MDFKNSKVGSITIEASIVFTVLLILITMIITAMNVQKTDIYMQSAIEQSSEDLAVIMPFTRITNEIGNAMLNDDDIGSSAKQTYNALSNLSDTFSDLAGVNIDYLILNGYLSSKIKNDIAANFIERTDSANLYTPSSIVVKLVYNQEQHILEEYITYSITTIFGDIGRSHYSAIPFYGCYSNHIGEMQNDIEVDTTIDPWSLGNFERGDYFKEQYGGNLPNTFPVIDSFVNGNAVSIVSIDLTKNTYSTSRSIEKKINEKLVAIDEFCGASATISGEKYEVKSNEIYSKELIIIVPENSPEERLIELKECVSNYPNDDFSVTIIRSGNSTT